MDIEEAKKFGQTPEMREEDIKETIWHHQKAFVDDVLRNYPELLDDKEYHTFAIDGFELTLHKEFVDWWRGKVAKQLEFLATLSKITSLHPNDAVTD